MLRKTACFQNPAKRYAALKIVTQTRLERETKIFNALSRSSMVVVLNSSSAAQNNDAKSQQQVACFFPPSDSSHSLPPVSSSSDSSSSSSKNTKWNPQKQQSSSPFITLPLHLALKFPIQNDSVETRNEIYSQIDKDNNNSNNSSRNNNNKSLSKEEFEQASNFMLAGRNVRIVRSPEVSSASSCQPTSPGLLSRRIFLLEDAQESLPHLLGQFPFLDNALRLDSRNSVWCATFGQWFINQRSRLELCSSNSPFPPPTATFSSSYSISLMRAYLDQVCNAKERTCLAATLEKMDSISATAQMSQVGLQVRSTDYFKNATNKLQEKQDKCVKTILDEIRQFMPSCPQDYTAAELNEVALRRLLVGPNRTTTNLFRPLRLSDGWNAVCSYLQSLPQSSSASSSSSSKNKSLIVEISAATVDTLQYALTYRGVSNVDVKIQRLGSHNNNAVAWLDLFPDTPAAVMIRKTLQASLSASSSSSSVQSSSPSLENDFAAAVVESIAELRKLEKEKKKQSHVVEEEEEEDDDDDFDGQDESGVEKSKKSSPNSITINLSSQKSAKTLNNRATVYDSVIFLRLISSSSSSSKGNLAVEVLRINEEGEDENNNTSQIFELHQIQRFQEFVFGSEKKKKQSCLVCMLEGSIFQDVLRMSLFQSSSSSSSKQQQQEEQNHWVVVDYSSLLSNARRMKNLSSVLDPNLLLSKHSSSFSSSSSPSDNTQTKDQIGLQNFNTEMMFTALTDSFQINNNHNNDNKKENQNSNNTKPPTTIQEQILQTVGNALLTAPHLDPLVTCCPFALQLGRKRDLLIDHLPPEKSDLRARLISVYHFEQPMKEALIRSKSSIVPALDELSEIERVASDLEAVARCFLPASSSSSGGKNSKNNNNNNKPELANKRKKEKQEQEEEERRIHATIRHTSAVSGRLSASRPNIFAISKHPLVRGAFCSRFGHRGIMMEADYSQMEVVVLCALAGDRAMHADLENKINFHNKRVTFLKPELSYTQVCEAVERKDPEITALRKLAKTFTFQRQYGAGAKSIAESTGLEVQTVQALIRQETEAYPEVESYFSELARNLFTMRQRQGRQRQSAYSSSSSSSTSSSSSSPSSSSSSVMREREFEIQLPSGTWIPFDEHDCNGYASPRIRNYPVQGFAADLMQFALAELWRRLRARGDEVLITNVVHDSVWLDVREDSVKSVAAIVRSVMEGIPLHTLRNVGLDLGENKFRVEISAGKDLGDMRDL